MIDKIVDIFNAEKMQRGKVFVVESARRVIQVFSSSRISSQEVG